MGRMHVAHLEAGALPGQPAGTERREPPLVRDLGQRVGLIHELRELRGAEELPHRGRRGLGVDQVLRHHGIDVDRAHALLDGALHAQEADAILILHQLADRAHPAVAEMVDVVDLALAVAQVEQRADHRDDVFLAQHAHAVVGVEIEPHVHLDAADRRKIVALRIEEQRLEHRLRGVERRRLARTHDTVDVEQRVFAGQVLVDRERVADIGPDIDVIDVEHRDFLVTRVVEDLQGLVGDLLARLDVDLAGLRVDEVLGDVMADELLVGHPQRLEPALRELARLAHGDLLSGFHDDLAAVGVDEVVDRLVALQPVGIEGNPPAVLAALVMDLAIEGVEDLLAVHAERIEQRRHRNLPPPVDARMHDVLGVEFDVEPGTAIGNDAGGEQQLARGMGLALVVIEEHAGRAVHLADDDPLGAVDDEGAVGRHQRDVAHVDILLLDVLYRASAGFLVDIEHDQPQRDLERGRIGHAALATLVDVVFGRLEFIAHELEHGGIGEVRNGKYGLEYRLEPLVRTSTFRLGDLQELVVRRLLNLDEVRHLGHFLDLPKELADALATGERLRHCFRSLGFVALATHPRRPRPTIHGRLRREGSFRGKAWATALPCRLIRSFSPNPVR